MAKTPNDRRFATHNRRSPNGQNWAENAGQIHGVDVMKVFFYGLFMSESLLATKGIKPTNIRVGFVDDYGLCIGKRATLIPRHGARAYGVVMVIAPSEITELYADDSVADYVPEPVTVEIMDGTKVQASCYNLPSGKVSGTNKTYAESLLEVATKLQLPEPYLDQIRQAGK